MATKVIAWTTGSGNITLTYTGHGNGSITVDADENDGSARSQVITVETVGGAITKNLTINQPACPIPVGTILNYQYTGSVQSVTLPAGKYKLQVWGAQGGSVSGSYTATGAKGGYSEGTLTLSQTTTVYIFVGGQGSNASTSTTGGMQNGGWNGGGGAPRICSYTSGGTSGTCYPRPGGGATDISTVTSDMSYSSYRNNRSAASLNARLIVAGGGAGASARYTTVTTTNTVSGTVKNSYYIGTLASVDLQEMSTSSIVDKAYWNSAGTIVSHGSYKIYKYAVTAGTDYWFSDTFPSGTSVYVVGWFNSSGDIVGRESYDSGFTQTYTDVKVTAPSGATYLYLNVYNTQTSSAKLKKLVSLTNPIIGEKYSSSFKYYTYSVSAGQTYNVSATLYNKDDGISVGTGIASKTLYDGSTAQAVSNGRYYSVSSTSGGTVTIPSGLTKMYIVVRATESAPTVTYTTSSSSSGTSNGTQVGGGTSGGGTNPGTQSGGGGELGKGANMSATNYLYASGGGGAGYYGGGSSYSDSSDKIDASGGGSGYVGSLENAQTKAGNTSFPSTSGGNETGHSGNGYARITRLDPNIMEFDYTGAVQSKTLSAGTYKIECWGAQGGSYNTTYYGGKGGYSVGKLTLSESTTVYVYVGGEGEGSVGGEKAGGFNGGGRCYTSESSYYANGSGGGASDVRIGQDSLYARVIVAGGGGGAGSYSSSYRYAGGAGGGTNGVTPSQYSTSYKSGEGGSQASRGTSHYYTYTDSTTYGTLAEFGIGAGATAGNTYRITGGGGGWYGGGYGCRAAGGGGSGYVYNANTASNYPSGCLLNSDYYLTDAETKAGNTSIPSVSGSTETGHEGNGHVRITKIS